jgi:hypothetical protein
VGSSRGKPSLESEKDSGIGELPVKGAQRERYAREEEEMRTR